MSFKRGKEGVELAENDGDGIGDDGGDGDGDCDGDDGDERP